MVSVRAEAIVLMKKRAVATPHTLDEIAAAVLDRDDAIRSLKRAARGVRRAGPKIFHLTKVGQRVDTVGMRPTPIS